MNPLIQLKKATQLLLIALLCFGLLPTSRAVSPPPDGGYPNGNTAEGDDALFSLTSGSDNTAVGFEALFSNTSGLDNTANGSGALYANTTGNDNTATGESALNQNTNGFGNTATGVEALLSNTTGSNNTANGNSALTANLTGTFNTANGAGALFSNVVGSFNTANGVSALANNTYGSRNAANGYTALLFNTGGDFNTASGEGSLYNNRTGHNNTADGQNALKNNRTGNNNTALGSGAGANLTGGDHNIDIGNAGVAGESNTIRIGTQGTQMQTFIAGILGTGVIGPPVKINGDGKLGVASSSARFKQEIRNMDEASDVLLALRPVTFRYKPEIDPEGVPQFGLVAEDVEKVNPDLVDRDADGKPYTVRYEAVNAMLLNEFLKEHGKVEKLEATITEQRKQIGGLTAGLQKVSARLDASKPTPQVVANNQ